jgi:protein O-mannosyl-transferase
MTKDRLNLLIILALCTVTSAIYARAAFFPFHLLDDPFVILGNTHLGFTLDSLKWAFSTSFTGNWHPVTWLSFMIDHSLFDKTPMGFHVVNVIFHVGNTVLLYLLLRYLTGAFWRSAAVAALFALHPLHVESVAWITERKDVLSAFF